MGKKELSVKDICEFIWQLEDKYNLLDWKIDNVCIWQVLRMQVYYSLTQKTGVFQNPHPSANKNFFQKITKLSNNLISYLMKNPFLRKKDPSHLLIPHPRKINGKDIYSEQLMKELKGDVLIIDHNESTINSALTLDFYYTKAYIKAKMFSKLYTFQKHDLERIKKIEDEIKEVFKITFPLENIFKVQLLKFKNLYTTYINLLKKRDIKGVFIVVAYAKTHIIAAAKSLGIKVVELQHGTITRYHLGYSYPSRLKIHYSPDILLVFGKYWSDTTDLPLNTKPIIIGAPYIESLSKKYNKEKEKNSIVFCSQGVIGERIFNFAYEVAEKLPKYTIYFNLHPSELLSDYKRLLLQKTKKLSNFKLVYKEPNIFELLAKSEYQAGVFSTTLFEGIALKTKIILIDLPGVEYMEPLCEKEKVISFKVPEEFVAEFHKGKLITNYKYFYDTPAKSILKKLNF